MQISCTDVVVNGTLADFSVYYAAFEAVSGDRLEFRIPGSEYGMLAGRNQKAQAMALGLSSCCRGIGGKRLS